MAFHTLVRIHVHMVVKVQEQITQPGSREPSSPNLEFTGCATIGCDGPSDAFMVPKMADAIGPRGSAWGYIPVDSCKALSQ